MCYLGPVLVTGLVTGPGKQKYGQSKYIVLSNKAARQEHQSFHPPPQQSPLPNAQSHPCWHLPTSRLWFLLGHRVSALLLKDRQWKNKQFSIPDFLDVQISLGGGFSPGAVCIISEASPGTSPPPPSRAAVPAWPRRAVVAFPSSHILALPTLLPPGLHFQWGKTGLLPSLGPRKTKPHDPPLDRDQVNKHQLQGVSDNHLLY